jgi:patatin-related protein
MHGVTKEIHRLVRASALRSAGEAGATPSEQVYAELLEELTKQRELPDLRVIVDTIAGTSAGGINGIYLAKALASNRSVDELTNLWFVRGDMKQLIQRHKYRFWRNTLPFLIGRALRRSVLRGNDMARWLHDALEGMDAAGGGVASQPASLLPPGHPLDLHVTITDFYGYRRYISLARPGVVADTRYRHVLTFHYDGADRNDFADNAGLTFAARTTSCFPGVFPPVSLAELGEAIGADLDTLRQRSFVIYDLNGDNPADTYFIDGGVLDNKPFGWAIDTIIRRRPADAEVDRRLLYIEPDPAAPRPVEVDAVADPRSSPSTLQAAIGAAMKIPRSEPILDDLLEVQHHNERVERIRDVIEINFDRVAALVREDVTPERLAATPPAEWPWRDWNTAMHAKAMTEAGLTYATYVRLKIASVLDGFASSICAICRYPEDSNHAALVREAVRAWARERNLFRGGEPADEQPCGAEERERPAAPEPYRPTAEQVAFLRAFDLGFLRRRMRFVIAAFNWWYRCVGQPSFPSRAAVDEGKAILYEAVRELDDLALLRLRPDAAQEATAAADALRQQVLTAFGPGQIGPFFAQHGLDGAAYLEAHADDVATLFTQADAFFRAQLAPLAPHLLGQLAEHTSGDEWTQQRKLDLVVRYLGFPIWDVLLYPVQELSQAGETDAIQVTRISPRESTLLPAEMPVEGVQLFHFYAFFHREARENDYLRGRLDAAEQLIGLLFSSEGRDDSPNAWCKRAFEAIIEEDGQALSSIPEKLAGINDQIAKL